MPRLATSGNEGQLSARKMPFGSVRTPQDSAGRIGQFRSFALQLKQRFQNLEAGKGRLIT